ncbi:hypothetical protein [uncultured Endozoicomonas sp.]|uniref:hypothetical protein n=1 Tax=uncultured Endozoicomonas sp. TaxID=432652 RepID=UPI00260773F6|nr:hypothetical protein [uncultured Endozoicomonas sp.]
MNQKSFKLMLLSSVVASNLSYANVEQGLVNPYSELLINPSLFITPSTSIEEVKNIISSQKQIIQLLDMTAYDSDILDFISRITLISNESLLSDGNASYYSNGNKVIYIPGLESKLKVQSILSASENSTLNRSVAEAPEQLDYYSITTALADNCTNEYSQNNPQYLHLAKQKVTAKNEVGVNDVNDITEIYGFEGNSDMHYLSDKELSNAGCQTALAEVKIYLKQPGGMTAAPQQFPLK